MQLNKPIQLSLFPTEEEQRTYIETAAESVAFTPFAFSFAQEEIDHVLRLGSNTDNHRMRIAAEFSKGKTVEENAAFLKELYHGGNGIKVDGKSISAWYAEDGIRFTTGGSARYKMQMNIMQEQKTTHTTPAESTRPERRCYTVDEVMEFLGVGRKAVYSLIHRKAFPAIRINNLGYRIPKESFNSWLLQK